MSPKELLYLEDAMHHEMFQKTQCQDAASKLQDAELKTFAQTMMNRHQQNFDQLFQLV